MAQTTPAPQDESRTNVVDLFTKRPVSGRVVKGEVVTAPETNPAAPPVNPGKTELGVDISGDTPLIPAWTKSADGWKARGAIAGRQTVRNSRHWTRRQFTEHGAVAKIGRGIAVTARWARGTEGAAIAIARQDVMEKAATATRAQRAVRARVLPGKEKDARVAVAANAAEDALSAQAQLARVRSSARTRIAFRSVAVLGTPVAAEIAASAYAGTPGMLAAGTALLAGLGVLGRKPNSGEEWQERTYSVGDGDPLTADGINLAMVAAGILKDGQTVRVLPPLGFDGNAWRATLALPDGVTYDLVSERLVKLAGAFGVNRMRVSVSRTKDEREDMVHLAVFSEDPFGKKRISPLYAKPQPVDVWEDGVLIGYDVTGEDVRLPFKHVLLLLGGASRAGKGMFLRNVICGLSLDPRVNVRVVAGAKPGEHRGYGPICSTFFGRNPERLIELLDAFLAEAYRREDILQDQGRAKFDERDLEEFPLEVLIIDEFKQYAESKILVPDPADPGYSEKGPRLVKAADVIDSKLEELAAFCAALNMTILVCTQDPDAKTVPRGFKSNTGARLATRTGSPDQTNAILKAGATGAGLRAHEIPVGMKGVGIVDADGANGVMCRGFFIEDKEFNGEAPIIAAGLALRTEAGRAPGQRPDPIEEQLLARTGLSSVAGGPDGSGRPGRPEDGPGAELDVLDHLIKAASPVGSVATAEAFTHLSSVDPEFARREDESEKAYGARAGKLLGERLSAIGVELTRTQLNDREGRPRGYTLDALQSVR